MEIPFFDTLCQIKYFRIGVRGNNRVDEIVFVVNRNTCDGLNLSDFTPYVKIENKKDNYFDKDGRVEVLPDDGSSKMKLKYELRRKTTAHPSVDIQLQFEHMEENDMIIWQTEAVNISFSRTIPADEQIANENPTIIQDFERRITRLENIKIINGGTP